MAPPDPRPLPDDSPDDSDSLKSRSPPPSSSPAHHSPSSVQVPPSPPPLHQPPPLPPFDGTLSEISPPALARNPSPLETTSSSNVAAAPSSAKPKSSKSAAAPRPSSPSPPPPPARPPLQTIRLDIQLGGPEDYEVNISQLAKSSGQRPATPVPEEAKRDTSDESEGDDEADNGKQPQAKGKRRKKRHHASEYYDTTDPFIDDSELAQDERTFFAQTKQKGFYVSSGQVALLNKVSAKKPKSKKINILAPSASVSAALSSAHITLPDLANVAGPSSVSSASGRKIKSEEGGVLDISIGALVSEGEDGGKLKRKMSEAQSATSVSEGGAKKRRKMVEIHPFPPELDQAIEVLKEAIAKENWDVKGKFPPGIKPLLGQVALKAIVLGEYDDNFFNLMPRLFPYNKFTMTKLIKRTIWREHTNLLLDRQNTLIEELRVLAEEGFPKAKEEWEKSVVQWERRQERVKTDTGADGPAPSHEGSPDASDQQVTPNIGPTPLESRPSLDDGEPDDGAGGGKGARDSHPPAKRYRLTDQMKAIIWQLVCLSNECCRIENEKNTLENSTQIVSDQGVRKTLYQKIVAAFPDGWLSSGQISREVSVMKKKYEKESMEIE